MLTAREAREILDYEPDTGVFRWKVRPGSCNASRRRAGDVAGGPNSHGYWLICINYKVYPAHRLAWLVTHGVWPRQHIDHIDRNKLNNAISNLRECDPSSNAANRVSKSTNGIGLKGVTRVRSGKFLAQISVRGKGIRIGLFETAESAHEAYKAAAQKHFGEFARFA